MDCKSRDSLNGKRRARAVSNVVGRWLMSLMALSLLLCAQVSPAQSQSKGVKNPGYRTKVNSVDVRTAPKVKVRSTFLNPRDVPINPELIDQFDVFVNDERIDRKRVKLGVWSDEEDGTDVVFVLPLTATLGTQAKKKIGKMLPKLANGLGERDRAALVTYTRAVTVRLSLSEDKGELGGRYGGVQPVGVKPFMFSSLNTGISLLEASPDGRKKAIVYIGDGTDASTPDPEALNQKLREVITRARKTGIQVWTVGYNPQGLDDVDVRSLEILARKTGATYRRADSLRDLLYHMDNTLGEIVGELVLTVDWSFEESTAYNFRVRFQSAKSPEIDSDTYKEKVGALKINWIFWSIFMGICCLLAFIGTIVGFFSLRYYRRQRAKERAEKLLADILKEGEEEEEGLIGAQKPPAPFVYDDKGTKLCNLCGRESEGEWRVGCGAVTSCRYFGPENTAIPEWLEKKNRDAVMLGQLDPEALAQKMLDDAK